MIRQVLPTQLRVEAKKIKASLKLESISLFAIAAVSFHAFERVPTLSSNNQAAESRYMMAKIHFELKRPEEAEKAANQANENNANYPFWIAKSILLLADIYIEKNDLLNARAAAEAVAENFKSDENLVAEANAKLAEITKKDIENNRIKLDNPDGTLELDTTGN